MERATIVAELEAERDRLDSAIAALTGSRITFTKTFGKPDGRTRPLSAAARKISQATKKRWAEWWKKKKEAA